MTDVNNMEVTLINRFPELQGFGLDISGGKDRPYISGDSGIFVSALCQNGIADKSGKINVEDKILKINGECVRDVTHSQAVQLFVNNLKEVLLTVEKYAGPPTMAMLTDDVVEEEIDEKLPQNLSLSDANLNITNNMKVKKQKKHVNMSGFLFGLALGCVSVILIKRFSFFNGVNS